MVIFVVQIILLCVSLSDSVYIDVVDCGIDHEKEVTVGDVDIGMYPWIGILYYIYYGDVGSEIRSTTTVVLIQREFVLAAAADVGPMPKHNFRKRSRVLLGEDWKMIGRRVRNYVIHPEYGEDTTLNSLALIQLRDPVKDVGMKPVCPPPKILRNPVFYVMKFKEDYMELQKEVIPVSHVPGELCKQFYVMTQLYSKRMRPPHAACAVSLDAAAPCVWHAGAALVARDVWGRWQLLGLGVRGPGCGAPSRYLDMGSYYPWIEASLDKFRRITISKINKQKYVLRSGETSSVYQRFGACDPEEKKNLIYREVIKLETDNTQFQFITYNMTIDEDIEYTCLTMEMVNATAVSEMRIQHKCPRNPGDKPCHYYETYDAPDFTIAWHEYRGQKYMTEFGFEPIDEAMWVPEYDLWTTTDPANTTTTTSTTTTTTVTTSRTKRYLRRRTKTPTTTTTTTTTTTPNSTTTPDTTTDTTSDTTTETTAPPVQRAGNFFWRRFGEDKTRAGKVHKWVRLND